MDRRYDPLPGLAGLLTAALSRRNDTGVYASAIARELGLFIEDDEATVLARLREALGVAPGQAHREFGDRFTVKPDTGIVELHCGSHSPFAEQWPVGYHPSLDVLVEQARAHDAEKHGAQAPEPPASRVKITVTLDCGHVLTYTDEIGEKYPFRCDECERTPFGKYPWKLTTEIVAGGPTVIQPHDEGTSYCTSLPLHDHDRPGETCPAYRFDDNGDRWPCIRPAVHNYPAGLPERIHIDQFGNKFRISRCQDPAAHGMPHCWCAVPGHHKPLTAYVWPCTDKGPHEPCRAPGLCDCACHGTTRVEDAPDPDGGDAPVYLLKCGCQRRGFGIPWPAGYEVTCTAHGDTTVVMAIPLGAETAP